MNKPVASLIALGGLAAVFAAAFFAYDGASGARPVALAHLEHADAETIHTTAEAVFHSVERTLPLEVGRELEAGSRYQDVHREIREALASGTLRDPGLSDEDAIEILLDEAATFLAARFAERDPSRYIAWREDTGYEFIGWEWLHRSWDFGPTWNAFFPGEPPLPESGPHEPAFEMLFNTTPDWNTKGADRPRALIDDPLAVAIVLGMQRKGGYLAADLQGAWPVELWEHGNTGALCPWWRPHRSANEIAEAHGSCTFAKLGTLIEFADGSRSPFVSTWLWDPDERWWFLEEVKIVRYGAPPGTVICY